MVGRGQVLKDSKLTSYFASGWVFDLRKGILLVTKDKGTRARIGEFDDDRHAGVLFGGDSKG